MNALMYQTKCMRNLGNIQPNWRHPEHSLKWNDNQIDQACQIFAVQPTLTLTEIIEIMVSDYNAPQISDTTLSSYLEFSLITFKNVTYHAVARNSAMTKSQRIDYCEFFIENTDSNFVFIDEVGYSIEVKRNRGRAPK